MTTQLSVGGRVYSPTNPDATAFAVEGDTVVWVGEDKVGRALHPDAQVIDLDGAFVAPAFVDTHVHTTATGLQLIGLDLSGVRSVAECLAAVRAEVQRLDDRAAIVWGHGWDESRWAEGRSPTTDELDQAAGGRTVYLSRIDVHSALASTALRTTCAELPDADGYHPQRPLTGEAHHLVRRAALAALPAADTERARRAALDHAAALGIAAVHECAGPQVSGVDDLRALLALDHGVEVRAYWGEAVADADEARALLESTGAHALGGDLFVDGALGSRTAWLHEPYADAPETTGLAHLDTDTVAAHLRSCTEAGIQAGFHVIGDAAVSVAVEALARVVDEMGGPAVAARGHRLEHLEMVTDRQAEALGAWGVIGAVQPAFDAAWGGPGGLYEQRLGPVRAPALNPLSKLAAAGVSLAFGSDAPVTTMDPWAMIRAAVFHHTPGSGISPRAAFSAATRGAWRAGGVRDGLAGTLVPGAPATYAVWEAGDLMVSAPTDTVQRWSTDPRSRVPALPDLDPAAPSPRCLRTVLRGHTVFAR